MSDKPLIDPFGIPFTMEQFYETADISRFVLEQAAKAMNRHIEHEFYLGPDYSPLCTDCGRDMSHDDVYACRRSSERFELLCTACAAPPSIETP